MSSWHLCSWAGRGRTQLCVFLSEMVLDWNVCQLWVWVRLMTCQLMGQTGQGRYDHMLPNALGTAHYFWKTLTTPVISFPVHFLLPTSFVLHCTENNSKERHSDISHNKYFFNIFCGFFMFAGFLSHSHLFLLGSPDQCYCINMCIQ